MQTRIKEIRQSKGMSLRMLAEESGIDKSTLCDVETGKTDSRVSTLLAIADALHVRSRICSTRRSQHSNPNRYKNNMTPSHGRTL